MRDVASVIISHELNKTESACCFQTLDAVFPTDLFLQITDYLKSYRLLKRTY